MKSNRRDASTTRSGDGGAGQAWANDPAGQVRQGLLSVPTATLSTLASEADIVGYPDSSNMPFALTAHGQPVVLLADVAVHAGNLRVDSRASLFIHELGDHGDERPAWGACISGRMEMLVAEQRAGEPVPTHAKLVSDGTLAAIQARYSARVPMADHECHGQQCHYWRLRDIHKVRYSLGSESSAWLDGDAILRVPDGAGLARASPGIMAHLNHAHAYNLKEICAGLYGFAPDSLEMTAIDRTGFFLHTRGPERLLYVPFGHEITAADLHRAVTDVLHQARRRLETSVRFPH